MATVNSLLMSSSCLYFGLLPLDPAQISEHLLLCRSVHVEVLQNICEMKVDCAPLIDTSGGGTST